MVVSSIDAGETADRAGLRVGDSLDVRANSAIERWQWFDGFPTPIVGHTTTFAVTRGTQHLRIAVTTVPWNFRRYWYFWLGPAGMFFVVLMAGLIAWRAAPTRANLTLAAALLALAAGAVASTNNFAVPWVWLYDALAMLANVVPVAAALWVVYASTFATPTSRTRRVLAILAFCTLAVIVVCNTAQDLALNTLWADPGSSWMGPLVVPWSLCIVLAIACSVLAVRSARGTERLRAGWSLTSLAAFFTVYTVLYYLPNYTESYDLYAFEVAVFNLNFFTLPLLLAYVTISRRLIDIGFVLNRAAVFTLVSAIVIGVFSIIEWALGTWLTEATHLTTSSISLAIAMILGLSLRFVHHHVDRLVDRVFFHKRHADEAALLRFAHECSYITDAQTLTQRTIETVTRHTVCESVAIVCPRADIDENDPAIIALQAWGNPLDLRDISQTALRGDYAFPMIARGELMGALVCGSKPNGESFAPDERKALTAVAHAVGITLDSFTSRNLNAVEPLRQAIAEMRDAIVRELRASSNAK